MRGVSSRHLWCGITRLPPLVAILGAGRSHFRLGCHLWCGTIKTPPHKGVCLLGCLKFPLPPTTPTPIPPFQRDFSRRFPVWGHVWWRQRRRGLASAARAAAGSDRGATSSVALPQPAICSVLSLPPSWEWPTAAPLSRRHVESGTRAALSRPCPHGVPSPCRGARPEPRLSLFSVTAPHGGRSFRRHEPDHGRDCLHS